MIYKFGAKNNWRAWQWNRITERLQSIGKHPRDAVVIYLGSRDGLDLQNAERRGFRKHNMIAIERERSAYKEMKSAGIPVIRATLAEALVSWPQSRPFDVVIQDFTCGYSDHVHSCNKRLHDSPGRSGAVVVSVNLLRGRELPEERIDILRQWAASCISEFDGRASEPDKNRGVWWFLAQYATVLDFLFVHERIGKIPPGTTSRLHSRIFDRALSRASFFSYKSTAGTLHYDSVVTTWPIDWEWVVPYSQAIADDRAQRGLPQRGLIDPCPIAPNLKLRRSIIATYAATKRPRCAT